MIEADSLSELVHLFARILPYVVHNINTQLCGC